MLKHKEIHLTKLTLKDVLLIKSINLTVQPSVFLLPQSVMYLAVTMFAELLSYNCLSWHLTEFITPEVCNDFKDLTHKCGIFLLRVY